MEYINIDDYNRISEDIEKCRNCVNWTVEFQAIGIYDKGVKEESKFKENFTYSNFGCNKFMLDDKR